MYWMSGLGRFCAITVYSTVCWYDGDGSPRYECDERLQGDYRVFMDSLDPG